MNVQHTIKSKLYFLLGISLLSMLILMGCNGPNSGGPLQPSPNPFTGVYRGTFSGEASGTVELLINSDNSISGTLVSNNLRTTPQQQNLTVGTPVTTGTPVATRPPIPTSPGTYNGSGRLTNGDFEVLFRVGSTDATFRGRLTASGTIVAAQNLSWSSTSGQSGIFTLQKVTNGGNPIPTTSPTTSPGTGECGTGTASATFVSSGASIDASALNATQYSASINTSGGAIDGLGLNFSNGCDAGVSNVRSFVLTMSKVTANLEAGKTYSLAPASGVPAFIANLVYTETDSAGNGEGWIANAGDVVIESISGNQISFKVVDARFVPLSSGAGGLRPGTGTFLVDASGRITATRTGN